jgi:hypothetical protein
VVTATPVNDRLRDARLDVDGFAQSGRDHDR